jgi:TP901 family phage tail tape measure protein
MALDTILNITANTRPAEQQIDRLTSRNYGIKLNIDSQPLGRITGQLSEFNKSMDAANARVVAFGASAGAIMVLEKSFRAMIDSTIEVEKSLKDIQVVLDVSGESMAKFGKGLFDIAKNTGQSFSVAAEAATEFSRQGLSMEDTLKRTSDALILSRLSGLGAAESVNVLTAAVNSFANQGVTAAEVVNKLATVDAAFAVSSKDLAEGISRVGASASQSGVSIDELIGLITSAQQATARGGAVIGNSFKTIFTRLERGKTQSLLESLGVDTKDDSGRIKSTVDMLKDLAKVYGTLGQGQQAEVAEKVGGVFQINILKAALADLGKEHSVYAGAVDISNSATDEATKRNEKLNETYAAQINRLQQGATQLAAAAGKRVLGPSMDRVIGTGNGILDNLNNIDSSSIGAKLGKGLLDGIGQVIAGPGLVLIGGVIIKLLGDFSKFAGGSVKELLGLNAASKEQAAIQSSITKMLERNPALLAQINSEAKTQSDQAKILLDFYMKQTAEMQKQAALTGQLASKLYTGGVRMGTEGVPVAKKAAGYIPEFASEEAQAKMLGAVNPKAMFGKGTIGGKRFIMNDEETEIPNYGSNGDSAVIPHYAKGYIPNFAEKRAAKRRSAQKQAELETKAKNKELKKQSGEPIDLGDQDRIGLI